MVSIRAVPIHIHAAVQNQHVEEKGRHLGNWYSAGTSCKICFQNTLFLFLVKSLDVVKIHVVEVKLNQVLCKQYAVVVIALLGLHYICPI